MFCSSAGVVDCVKLHSHTIDGTFYEFIDNVPVDRTYESDEEKTRMNAV